MSDTVQLLDKVALTVDLPEINLRRGQVGTVVDILNGGRLWKWSFAIGKGAPTPPSAFALIRSCSCAMILRQQNPERGSNDEVNPQDHLSVTVPRQTTVPVSRSPLVVSHGDDLDAR